MPLVGDGAGPQLWAMHPTDRAVVRGSAQRPELFDLEMLEAQGVALTGRRSGGAAVWIEPSAIVWIDVLAPRGSGLWSDDLVQTFLAVGRCWQRAFAQCGVEATLIENGPGRGGPGDSACWAGHGWGELVLDGAKLVGLSQRRTRWGARVQGMAVVDNSASLVADALVSLSDAERADVRRAIGSVDLDLDRAALESAAIEALLLEL